jgi:hypothetical protein
LAWVPPTVGPVGLDFRAPDVDDACVWARYDSDFPVAYIRDGHVTG